MSPEQVQALARAIADQHVHTNLWFYVLWFLATFIVSALGAWGGAYFRKRGEHSATKADFEGLIDQLKKTTVAAEGVRTDIAHSDWTAREWKSLRRVKAEELLIETEKAKEGFRLLGVDYLFSELRLQNDLGARVYTLALLYFPEALIPTIHFCALLNDGTNLLLDIRSEMNAEGVPLEHSAVRTRRLPEILAHTGKLDGPVNEMHEIVRSCLWNSFNLPEYVFDSNQAIATMEELAKPQPSQTDDPQVR